MVNFEDGSTVGTPPQELLKILVLQTREDAKQAFRIYFRTTSHSGQERTENLTACMRALFMEVQDMIRNYYEKKPAEYAALRDKVYASEDPRVLLEVWDEINYILYKKNIIKIDTRRQVDQYDIEASNEQFNV